MIVDGGLRYVCVSVDNRLRGWRTAGMRNILWHSVVARGGPGDHLRLRGVASRDERHAVDGRRSRWRMMS